MSPALAKVFSDLDASGVMSGMFGFAGAETNEVFDAMRERRMNWTTLDTKVGGMAGYRVCWYKDQKMETQQDLLHQHNSSGVRD